MLDRKLELKYLVKCHTPDLCCFHSRKPLDTASAFIYRDVESAQLSALLLQIQKQAQGYTADSHYFTVELLNGSNVNSLFSTKDIRSPIIGDPLSPDFYIVSEISRDHQDPSEGRERMLSLLRPWQAMESLNMDLRYFSQASLKRYSMLSNTRELKEGFFIFPEKGDRHCIGPFGSPEAMLLSVEAMTLRTKRQQESSQAFSM